jgi:hypothetical protein
VTSDQRPAAADHLCWGYDDAAAFDRDARDFLAVGSAAGQRVRYVAWLLELSHLRVEALR